DDRAMPANVPVEHFGAGSSTRRIVGADYDVVACEDAREFVAPQDIGLHDSEIPVRSEALRAANDRRHFVAATQSLGENLRADESRCSNKRDLHGEPPREPTPRHGTSRFTLQMAIDRRKERRDCTTFTF